MKNLKIGYATYRSQVATTSLSTVTLLGYLNYVELGRPGINVKDLFQGDYLFRW